MSTRASRAAASDGARASAQTNRSARARRKPSSLKKKIKNALALLTLLVLTPVAIGVIYLMVVFVQVSKEMPALTELGEIKAAEGTKIYYSDNSVMAILASENRQPKPLKEISKKLIDATIAVEDSRFYEHRGVDLHGIARAMFRNASEGEMRQGASTITQQLARNIDELGLTREKKLRRKVQEAILAMRIEQSYSKEEILELYLNQIPYGHGAYGIEAAAKTYFKKHAKDLDLAQASFLAGIPQRPALYSNNVDAALRRRDMVLARMVDTGKITPAERDRAKEENLKLPKRFEGSRTRIFGAPYVVNFVMQQVEKEFGADAVFNGWKIYTTIHPGIQHAAEETLAYGIHHYGDTANQAALICIDPKSGQIRAMVGGLDFKKNQYNIVTQGLRQPGSSFKPIVYLAAFDNDVCTLDKTYHDDSSFEGEHAGNTWHPQNYGGKHYGTVTVETALKQSINTIAVKVACETGLGTVIDYARRLGISTIDPARDKYPPLALGAASVRPIELATAYTVFANNGKRATPMIISRVVDDNGDVVKDVAPDVQDTHIKEEALSQLNQALREVVLHGTATAAADVPDAHGKTGTTSDNRDAWFAGYTPELVTIIWAGREQKDKKGHMRYLEMPGATGGHLCAPTWRDFMMKAVPIQQAALKSIQPPAPTHVATTASLEDKKKKPDEKKPLNGATVQQGPLPEGTNPADPNAVQPAASPDGAPPGVAPPSNTGTVTPPTTGIPPQTAVQRPGPTVAAAPPAVSIPVSPPASASIRPARREISAPPSDGGGRVAAPPVHRSDPGDEMVSVRICSESGQLANGQWCPATYDRRIHRRDMPRRCRVHRAPPGEG
jgi:penicillin-binding protein 1A